MRTLLAWFNLKVSVLEDGYDLNNLTKDDLYGILIAYDIITGLNKTSKKKEALKVTSKYQSKNQNDEEGLFISRLNKGTREYKGKLPLKFFNYGRIGHFSHKCPYPKQEVSDHEKSCCHKGRKKKKKKFYSGIILGANFSPVGYFSMFFSQKRFAILHFLKPCFVQF